MTDRWIGPVSHVIVAKHRDSIDFDQQRQPIEDRLDALIFSKPTHADCRRICHRLVKHRFELLFLEKPAVPADNNLAERDIRSVAAARADGGVNRIDFPAPSQTAAGQARLGGVNSYL